MFNYDWFHGTPFQFQQEEARIRCTLLHFPGLDADAIEHHEEARRFHDDVEVRRLIYLRDGFSYEVRELADMPSKAQLAFECEPVDEQYRVGSFVVSVPYDEIVRVECFAVHPTEKPEDMPQITGFRGRPDKRAPDGAPLPDHAHLVNEERGE